MKQTLIAIILITLLFSSCSHKTPNPPIEEPSLTTTQKVAGTTGGLLLGVGGAMIGGMMGMLVSGGTSGTAPLIGVVLGGVLGAMDGISLGVSIGGSGRLILPQPFVKLRI